MYRQLFGERSINPVVAIKSLKFAMLSVILDLLECSCENMVMLKSSPIIQLLPTELISYRSSSGNADLRFEVQGP